MDVKQIIDKKIKDLKKWYLARLNRTLLLVMIIASIAFVISYIPYLNIVFSRSIGLVFMFILIYILFPPSTNKLVGISIILISLAFIFTLLRLFSLAESLGIILFLVLVFIFINYIKDFMLHKGRIQE